MWIIVFTTVYVSVYWFSPEGKVRGRVSYTSPEAAFEALRGAGA